MADVYVGGYQGFDVLKTAAASATLRATGRVGLYEHQTGVRTVYDEGVWTDIQASFAGTGPGYAELPYFTTVTELTWFLTGYKLLYTGAVQDAAVNMPNGPIDPVVWALYVAAAKAAGIARVSPIFSPNNGIDPYGDFATMPVYASVRAAAVVGGGLSMDTPPHAALIWGAPYIATIVSEITWARSMGVHSTVILSPHAGDDGVNFLENTVSYVAQLAAANALPDTWVVETYATDGTTLVGSAADPESVAGVALFMATSNDTASSIAAGPASFAWSTPLHFTVGGTRRVSVVDSGGQAYVVGGSGGLAVSSSGANDHVWTAAGSMNFLSLGASAVVDSRGTDVLSVGDGSVVTVEGSATISGSTGSSTFTILGSANLMSHASGTGDMIEAAAGSHASLTASGSFFSVTDNGAASMHVAEMAGMDNNVVDVSGHAVIYGGLGHGLTVNTVAGAATVVMVSAGGASILSNGTGDNVTGSSGASTVNVTGTASVVSQSGLGDTIIANTGSTVGLAVTGRSFNLFENMASVHVSETGGGDNSSLDVSGGNAVVYGGAGQGLSVQTTAGVATRVTLGSGAGHVLSQGTGDVVIGNSAASTVNVTGTASVVSQSAVGDVVIANTGSTVGLAVTGRSFNLFENMASVHVSETGGGDNSSLDVSGGNAVVYGGAGQGLSVQTTAGVATRVTLGSGAGHVLSQGTGDVVIGNSMASTVNVTGTASVVSQSAVGDVVIANTGSTVGLAVTGRSFNLFENMASVHVSETGGGDNSSLDVSGGNAVVYGGAGQGLSVQTTAGVATRVTLGSGAGHVLSQGTGDVVIGNSMASTVNVTGTASVVSQSAVGDVVIANTGSTVGLAVTGRSFNLFENMASVHVSETGGGDNSSLDVSGGNAVVYGGAGQGLSVQTTAGVATRVTLGSGAGHVLSQGTGDVVIGNSMASTVNVTGTASVVSQSAVGDVVIANTGSTVGLSVTGRSFNLFENMASVHVSETGGGDNSSLDVSGGNAVVYGGAGQGLSVQTTAGVATRVTLGSGAGHVLSQGTGDVVIGNSMASTVNVTGTASVVSQSAVGDVVIANTGSTVGLAVTGRSFNLFENMASVHVSETGGGDNSSLDVSGGNAVVYGGAGQGLSVQTTAGVATTVTLGTGDSTIVSLGSDIIHGGSGKMNFIGGAGASTVVGGMGAMTVTAGSGNISLRGSNAGDNFFSGGGTVNFLEGSGNNLVVLGQGNAAIVGGSGINAYVFAAGTGSRFQEIQNFHSGADTASFKGFSGNAIASQSVSNGSLTLTLTDGDVVRFDGITRLS